MTLPAIIPYAGGSLLEAGPLPARDGWPAEALRTCAGCVYQGPRGCTLGLRPLADALACKRWAIPPAATPAPQIAVASKPRELTPLQSSVLDLFVWQPGPHDTLSLARLLGVRECTVSMSVNTLVSFGALVRLPLSNPRARQRFSLPPANEAGR